MLSIHHPDLVLTWSFIILILLGLLMLFTSSSWLSLEKTGQSTYYLLHQILYGLLPGIVLFYLCSKISLTFLRKLIPFLFILTIISLIIVFVPNLGFESGGASRWLVVGSITLQPSEFAKLVIILYLAAFFEKKINEKKICDFKEGLIPFIVILIPFGVLLLMQPDMGTLGIICLIALLMFFSAGARFLHILFLIFLGLCVLAAGCLIFPYQVDRISTFLNQDENDLGSSYQINQSLIAIGSGGLLGIGFGNGIQKYNYLPQPMGDSIFAIWAEETGLIGSAVIMFLFLIICARGFIIAKRAPDSFSRLLAIGIVCWISIQAFLHIMAVCGLIPFSGMPLPFISYGGTALIFTLIGAGILVNISRKTV